jgi:hypothetical protein
VELAATSTLTSLFFLSLVWIRRIPVDHHGSVESKQGSTNCTQEWRELTKSSAPGGRECLCGPVRKRHC